MKKEIDINNEEEILEECDFDFFYDCELCSFELCMFYNDILCRTNNVHSDFNTRSALIDLGRIAITFNKLVEILKELEKALEKANINNYLTDYYLVEQENQQLKQEIKQLKFDCAMYKSANYLINDVGIDKAREIIFQSEQKLKQLQNEKAIEVLEKIRKYFYKGDCSLIDGCELEEFIANQLKELGGEKE